jgi:hypothetical protein
MPAPTDSPEWATDTNYTSGPDTGTGTKATPSAGVIGQGFIPGDYFGSQWVNWLLNLLSRWVVHLAARDFQVPLTWGQAAYVAGSLSWGYVVARSWTSLQNTGVLNFDLPVVPGTYLNSISVRVDPGAARAGANRMNATLYAISSTGVGSTAIATVYDDATANAQTITLTPGSPILIADSTRYVLEIIAGNTGAASPDNVAYINVAISEP